MHKVIIIGSGLAGLTTAYLLKKRGISATILEAEDRLGGRIFTKQKEYFLYELGATWVFQDPLLKQLLNDLNLELYPQYLKGDALINYGSPMPIQKSPTEALMNGAVYHKIKGGTSAMIQALADTLDPSYIHLNKKVTEVQFQEELVAIKTADEEEYQASSVVITAPPKVIAQQIRITPDPGLNDMMKATHTWMGDSSKFTVYLDRDYWRRKGLSGFVFSNHGLIREMQDHSTDDFFGLTGFLNPTEPLMDSPELRREMAAEEIGILLGASEIVGYEDYIWATHFSDEKSGNYNSQLMPHQNNGHTMYQQSHCNGRLYFAGAETSATNPGYMEGAVQSAIRTVKLLRNL